eukprot:CAMPEP_0196696572 /NCGR_PEP_ID=MMETSP1090-20130531/39691_1 /TAXON_ID=37098 /ORGANISM="Isochrysis sp, Strain CCMP1244" /LENGTH=78 /DNA_ID=CAMNT_0042036169 /DNA_START=173 /DNA_END=409 /DNA_ORIENTATION=+
MLPGRQYASHPKRVAHEQICGSALQPYGLSEAKRVGVIHLRLAQLLLEDLVGDVVEAVEGALIVRRQREGVAHGEGRL